MTSLSASACRAGGAGVGILVLHRAQKIYCNRSAAIRLVNHRRENLRRPTASGSQRRLCAEVRLIVTDEARIYIIIGGPSRTESCNPRSCAADHLLNKRR